MEFFEESFLIFSNFLKIQDNTGQILQIQDKFCNTGQFLKIQDIQDTLDSLMRTPFTEGETMYVLTQKKSFSLVRLFIPGTKILQPRQSPLPVPCPS